MVTINQIQKGFVRFIDNEVAVAFSGWQRVLVAGTAGLFASKLQNVIKTYGNHPLMSVLDVCDLQNGRVDIDAIYEAYAPQINSDKMPIEIPTIGTIKIGKQEIDLLVQYIKES